MKILIIAFNMANRRMPTVKLIFHALLIDLSTLQNDFIVNHTAVIEEDDENHLDFKTTLTFFLVSLARHSLYFWAVLMSNSVGSSLEEALFTLKTSITMY